MKTKKINLTSPKNYNALTVEQWRILDKLKGKYTSEDAYLTNVFLHFCNLKPMLYAERWRRILGSIPFIKRFVRKTGRQIVEVYEDGYISWKQIYRFRGWRNLLGATFWMNDEEVVCFKDSFKWLLDEKAPPLTKNPVPEITIGKTTYYSARPRLSDMQWQHYNACNAAIYVWLKSKNPEHILMFLSHLYLKEKQEDNSSRMSPEELKKLSIINCQLSIELILRFWEGCQRDLAKDFPHLFKKESGNKVKKTDYMKQESEVTIFIGKQSYSKPDEVRSMFVRDALEYLEQNAEQVEKEKREIEKMKRRKH